MALALQTKEEAPKQAASFAPDAAAGVVRPKIGVRPAFLNKNSDADAVSEVAATVPSPTASAQSAPERRLHVGTLFWVLAAVALLALTLRGLPSATVRQI